MRCREEEEQEALSQTSLPILRGEREKETGEAISKMKRIGIHPPAREVPSNFLVVAAPMYKAVIVKNAPDAPASRE